MRALVLSVALSLLAVTGASPAARIVGGEVVNIAQFPYAAALLLYFNGNWMQYCGAIIVNNRSFLTVSSCVRGFSPFELRARVGSSLAHSGGVVHDVSQIFMHPNYVQSTVDFDIAMLRSATAIALGSANVRAASIAGPNYAIPDNLPVTVIGWGATAWLGLPSEQLRQVAVATVNQAVCRERHAPRIVSDNMLCAGALDVGGRDACVGDSGGPLLHNDVVVGVTSWTQICGSPRFPFVYTRVPRFTDFITQNA